MSSAAYGSVFTRFWWAYKVEFFFSLFTSCWSLGSDPHGGGGEELAGERSSIQTCLSSTSPVLVPALEIWLSPDSGQNHNHKEMNCTEVPIFTKGFGFTVNCCPCASSCGPIGYGMESLTLLLCRIVYPLAVSKTLKNCFRRNGTV